MREAGYPFEVITIDLEENYEAELQGAQIPEQLARMKSHEIRTVPEDLILITADTVVLRDDQVMGKPRDRDHALSMLRSLSGRYHEVITGVCIRNGEKEELFHASTSVHFRKIDEESLIHYVDRHQPFDKAGAYGIQEWIGHIGVDRIEGSFFNVMGLPIDEVHHKIQKLLGH